MYEIKKQMRASELQYIKMEQWEDEDDSWHRILLVL